MTDSTPPKPDSSAEPAPSVTNINGGINIDAQHDVTISGEAVGRDKTTTNIDTQGGAHVAGDVHTTEFVGRDNMESAGRDIIHAASGATVTVVTGVPRASEPEDLAPAPGEPPFKGLLYFDEADADLFFGRETLTAQVAARLRDESLLTIVGASGSGKSSIVRAGIVPLLRHEHPRWQIRVIKPTEHPLEALAASLTADSASVIDTITCMDDLARDPRSLHIAVRRLLARTSADRLLIVVDQFEELFTLCQSDVERSAFVDNLVTAAATVTAGPTIVVITLRADFYEHCLQFDNLHEALEHRQAIIGAMSIDEMRRAIQEPAKLSDWEFETGLVDLILRDVGDEPGALPLLSHALLETWKNRQGCTLTLAGYSRAGGVKGAIAKTAETVFNQLKLDQQEIARSIFLRLTELGEGAQATRRRVALSELITNPLLQTQVEFVRNKLTEERLVITERDMRTKKDFAEVAHEALIREWPRLRAWLDEDRESLRLHRQLGQAVQIWQDLKRDEGSLYRGAQLAQALEWAASHEDDISALEQEFLQTSRSDAERDAAVREAARKYELDQLKKEARQREKEARQREEEARLREKEARQREEEARQREKEARKLAEKASRARMLLALVAPVAILATMIAVIYSYGAGVQHGQSPTPTPNRVLPLQVTLPLQVVNEVGGDIVIVTGRNDEIAADAIALYMDGSSVQGRLAAKSHVTLTLTPSEVRVRLLPPPEADKKTPEPSFSALLRVVVPPAVDLPDISTHSGNLEIYGDVGNVTAVITNSGDIEVFGADGDVNLSTQRGSITADIMQGRDITLHAAEGDIDLNAINALVSAATTYGNIRFYGTLRAGQTHFFTTTAAGGIQVTLPAYPVEHPAPQVYRFYVTTSASPVNIDYPTLRASDGTALPICGFIHSNGPIDRHEENILASTGRIEVSPAITGTYFFSGTLATNYYRFDTNQTKVAFYMPPPQSIHIYTADQLNRIITGKESIAPECQAALEADSGSAIVLRMKTDRGPVFIHHMLMLK